MYVITTVVHPHVVFEQVNERFIVSGYTLRNFVNVVPYRFMTSVVNLLCYVCLNIFGAFGGSCLRHLGVVFGTCVGDLGEGLELLGTFGHILL